MCCHLLDFVEVYLLKYAYMCGSVTTNYIYICFIWGILLFFCNVKKRKIIKIS